MARRKAPWTGQSFWLPGRLPDWTGESPAHAGGYSHLPHLLSHAMLARPLSLLGLATVVLCCSGQFRMLLCYDALA